MVQACRCLVLAGALLLAVVAPFSLWALDVPAAPGSLPHNPELLTAARAANQVHQWHLQALITQLSDEQVDSRIAAIGYLGRLGDPAAVPHLLPFLDPDLRTGPEVTTAILALNNLGADIAPQLRSLINRNNPVITAAAYTGLARQRAWGVEDWKQRAEELDNALRASAVVNLSREAAMEAGDILAKAVERDRSPHIRRMATLGLGRLGDTAWVPRLSYALTDPDPFVRRYAAEGLAALNAREALPKLFMALEANVAGNHIHRAVVKITGEDFGFDHRAHRLARQDAIERAFEWYSAQPKD